MQWEKVVINQINLFCHLLLPRLVGQEPGHLGCTQSYSPLIIIDNRYHHHLHHHHHYHHHYHHQHHHHHGHLCNKREDVDSKHLHLHRLKASHMERFLVWHLCLSGKGFSLCQNRIIEQSLISVGRELLADRSTVDQSRQRLGCT